MNKLTKIQDLAIKKDQVVLLRMNLDLIFKNGQVVEAGEFRIIRSLPTLKYLLQKKAKVVIVGHRGRPNGKKVKSLSLQTMIKVLTKLIRQPVKFLPHLSKVSKKLINQSQSRLFLLENIRFESGEEINSSSLAKKLSSLADWYVNDDFATCHRLSASLVGVTKFLPSAAGFNLINEITNLSQVFSSSIKPKVCLMGGAKVSTKLLVIKNLWPSFDKFVFLGGIANSYLAATGQSASSWLVDKSYFSYLKKLNSQKVYCPTEVIVTTDSKFFIKAKFPVQKLNVRQVGASDLILDLNSTKQEQLIKIIKSAKLIIWNGAPGYFENPLTASGSFWLAKILSQAKAKTYVGGGETVEIIERLKLMKKFTFVSTGGGAMLEFLAGKKLPAIEALKK